MKATLRSACLVVVSTAFLAGCDKPEKAVGSRAAAAKRGDPTATAAAAAANAAAKPGANPTTPDKPSAPDKPKASAKPLPPATPAMIVEMVADLARWDAASKEDRRAAAKEVAKHAPGFELLRVEEFTCGGQTHEVAIFKHAKTEMEFALVPGGTFDMGSPETEKGREVFENLHPVKLTKPFLIARTECTQATWAKVVGTEPSKNKAPDLPVEMVSWEDAQGFCEKTGLSLPTEAQWERACRAGTSTRFYHGDDLENLSDYAWYASGAAAPAGGDPAGPDAQRQTQPVGKKSPNAFGLFDMLGNVNEWCADMMNPYPTAAVVDPFTAIDAKHVSPVFRGGSFRRADVVSRPAFRLSLDADAHDSTIGFRPAKTVSME